MELNIVIEILFGLFIFAIVRGLYVMGGLLNGIKTLSNYQDDQLVLKTVKTRELKRKVIEGTFLMMFIASIGFAMYLFATSGSM